MKSIIILCLAIAAVSAEPALRVKWGLSGDVFIEIPRLRNDLIAQGWVKTTRYEGAPLPALELYCPSPDVTVCAFTDDTGFIAGLQVALAKDIIPDWLIEPSSVGFATWTLNGVEYFVQQQFFVSEEFLSKRAAVREYIRRAANYATLAEGSLWLPDMTGALFQISTNETDIKNSVFTEQACVPTMGLHYYYKMNAETDCTTLYPWFKLTNGGELVGTGFMAAGTYPEPTGRMWFERPGKDAVQMIVPYGPQCLYDMGDSLITLHVYYTQYHPATITC